MDLGSSHLFKCAPLKRQSVAHNSLNSLFFLLQFMCVLSPYSISFCPSVVYFHSLPSAPHIFFLLSNHFPLFIFCNDLRTFLLLFVAFHGGGDATVAVAVPAALQSSCHFFFSLGLMCMARESSLFYFCVFVIICYEECNGFCKPSSFFVG